MQLQIYLLSQDLQSNQPQLTNTLSEPMKLFERQLQRLNELVNTMLDLSRISTGHFTLNLQKIDLAHVDEGSIFTVRLPLAT